MVMRRARKEEEEGGLQPVKTQLILFQSDVNICVYARMSVETLQKRAPR